MENTKYGTQWGELTINVILRKLQAAKRSKYSRALHCKCAVMDATLGKKEVRLFLCKRKKAEKWSVLVTTGLKLNFMKHTAFYAMRWGIEVFYEDTKRNLGLSDAPAATSLLKPPTLCWLPYDTTSWPMSAVPQL